MIEVAAALRAEVEGAAARFGDLDEAAAGRVRGPGKWSRKEILGHLIDSAANNHQRLVRGQFENPFVGPGYDQLAWVAVHRYQRRSWRELIDLWAALNRHLAEVIQAVPAQVLGNVCTIGGESHSLEWLIRDYVRHLKHHLAQIEEK